jgi:hypothetical protein
MLNHNRGGPGKHQPSITPPFFAAGNHTQVAMGIANEAVTHIKDPGVSGENGIPPPQRVGA